LTGRCTTYLDRRGRSTDPLAALRREGYDVGGTERVTTTVLDTFDGRLAAAGLRLELTMSSGLRRSRSGELVLADRNGAAARLAVAEAPRTPGDLPAGPMRLRLARLLDVRVLGALVTVDAQRTVATKRNRAGKITAAAVVYTDATAGDRELPGTMVDVNELAGYPAPAAELREHLEAAGMRPAGASVVELAAVAVGADLRGHTHAPGIAIDPGGPARAGFRAVLANLRDAVVANWAGTIDDTDPEFLHDLRVAVRRTRSVLANAKGALPAAVRDEARDDFGWLGQITGPARDLDVYQIEWPTYTADLPVETTTALEPVRSQLQREREAAHRELAREMAGSPARLVIDRWNRWLDDATERPADPGIAPGADAGGQTIEPSERSADEPIGPLIAKRIRRAHRTMIERGRTITPDTAAEELHELRKDAKKLRYLLECFGGLYDRAARKTFGKRLKSLQDNLGEHQDAEVHVAHLRELSDRTSAGAGTDTVLATGQLIERMEQRRVAAREEFAGRFDRFDSEPTRRALDALLSGASPAPPGTGP